MSSFRGGPTAIAMIVLASAIVAHGQDSPRYRDPKRPVNERVADLLARMTIEEKVAQLQVIWVRKAEIQDADGRFNPAKAKAILGNGIGQVSRASEIAGTATGPRSRSPRQHAEYVNAIQKWVLENTRLAIPVMFHEEALHGLAAPAGTNFPVPIALGSTWDPALVERIMSAAAKETRARGCQQVLSPCRRSRPRCQMGTHRRNLR
jgi:beta-glucosidase